MAKSVMKAWNSNSTIYRQPRIMAIKDITEEIFKKNTGYALPEHAIDQSQSLNALSRDLYTDAKRFIYELLQNADDSAVDGNKVKVSIRLFGNNLVVSHTGKPFEKRDLRGLCGVNDGTKKNSQDKTGFKGIGFKAVFGQSDNVTVFSQGEYFRFDAGYKHNWRTDWAVSQEAWEAENDRLFDGYVALYMVHCMTLYTTWNVLGIHLKDRVIL